MRLISSLVTGLLFGLGLIISGMANPQKVLNFLDLFGSWDPSLIFVMAGAIGVTLPGYALLKMRTTPLLATQFVWPTATEIDFKLIAGSVLFGLGWGMAGFCPGPAFVALGSFSTEAIGFVAAMLVGMYAARQYNRISTNRLQPS